MSGGPPHHHHNRPPPTANPAWNHLQVPYFPGRQPQHAHMSNEHHVLHQSTWHTPTTTESPVKPVSHSHIYNLEQMLSDRQFPRHAPGVDLTLTRNGGQNGDLPAAPISLSVRDANKINSLPPSVLEVAPFELTAKCVSPSRSGSSPGVKSASPSVSPSPTEVQAQAHGSPKSAKRPVKRVDAILERLAPEKPPEPDKTTPDASEKPTQSHSVIVQPARDAHDDASDSSVPVSSNVPEDDAVSLCSNEDSLDGSSGSNGSKSRRKRKPSKTVRVTKEEDDTVVEIPVEIDVYVPKEGARAEEDRCVPEPPKEERRRSNSEPPASPASPRKTRRKTSSESETIANIAAMVQEPVAKPPEEASLPKPILVSVIKTKEKLEEPAQTAVEPQPEPEAPVQSHVIVTPAQKKIVTNTHFVEVENQLEVMFAGLEDETSDPLKTDGASSKAEEAETAANQAQAQDVTSTSNDFSGVVTTQTRTKRKPSKAGSSRRSSECSSLEMTPKKKKTAKKAKNSSPKTKKVKKAPKHSTSAKLDQIKDVYAYDSGSNASSSKSKGPFIQIRGPRDSPLSVNVINAPLNDDDAEKKPNKTKKYHDDSEYRHKVRSKGLHCSTLSNKYDSQTRDVSWICAFCKRGPHAGDPKSAVKSIPGDLFGPYIITTKSPEYERRLEDPYDRQFKSKKVNRSLDSSNPTTIKITGKKSKRKHSESLDDISDVYVGITDTGCGTYEVWAHEDCIVWSMGVYLSGPKIVGLEEAVWTSCNVACNKCLVKGANVCCLKRGCVAVVHFCCAPSAGWQLDEGTFGAFCGAHRKG